MLRLLVVAVLLANLLLFGWTHGWFAPAWPPPRQGEREPERLAAQVRPEAVKVLPPSAASAALRAAREAAAACLQAGPFTETDLAAAEAALAAASMPGASWAREPVATPPPWLVYAGRVTDAAARRAREAELDRRGLAHEWIESPPELAPGLVLSRHASRAEAEAALTAAAASQPLKGARVLALPAPPPQFWLRAPRADTEQQARLLALPAPPLAGGFKPCAAGS